MGVGCDPAQDVTRVKRGGKNSVLEKAGIHMVRTAKRGESAARFEEFERAQMNFFVAAQCVGNRCAITGKRRRVKDNEVETGHNFLVRFGCGLRLEPIEDIDGLE